VVARRRQPLFTVSNAKLPEPMVTDPTRWIRRKLQTSLAGTTAPEITRTVSAEAQRVPSAGLHLFL